MITRDSLPEIRHSPATQDPLPGKPTGKCRTTRSSRKSGTSYLDSGKFSYIFTASTLCHDPMPRSGLDRCSSPRDDNGSKGIGLAQRERIFAYITPFATQRWHRPSCFDRASLHKDSQNGDVIAPWRNLHHTGRASRNRRRLDSAIPTTLQKTHVRVSSAHRQSFALWVSFVRQASGKNGHMERLIMHMGLYVWLLTVPLKPFNVYPAMNKLP